MAVGLTALLGLLPAGGDDDVPTAVEPQPASLRRVVDDHWPRLGDDLSAASFVEAAGYAAAFLDGLPPERVLRFGDEERTAMELARGMRRAAEIVAATPDPSRRVEALQADFVLLASTGRDGRGEVLVTGYFEPVLEARRTPEPPFLHPIYGVPDDLVTVRNASGTESHAIGRLVDGELVPYPDRATIDRGEGMPEGTDVLGWLADPLDVFFVHVQGSGTLVFEDGERVRAGYAFSNGREYRSIGQLLIDEGAVPAAEMSMQAIRRYLTEHPDQLERVLSYNPRYVFFRRLDHEGGPVGCFGVPVTAGRSIATDLRVLPAPIVALLEGSLPSADGGDQPIRAPGGPPGHRQLDCRPRPSRPFLRCRR